MLNNVSISRACKALAALPGTPSADVRRAEVIALVEQAASRPVVTCKRASVA